jgi:heme/copper-type cytochrome/quinol oxidase subunit 4
MLLITIVAAYPIYKLFGMPMLEAFAQSMLVFFCLTIGAYALIVSKGTKSKEMLGRYMASIGLKMLIALIYFVVMLKSFKGHEVGFALCFFSAYLIATFFELYYLLSNLRQNSDTPNNAIK